MERIRDGISAAAQFGVGLKNHKRQKSKAIWVALMKKGVPNNIIEIIKVMYTNAEEQVWPSTITNENLWILANEEPIHMQF